MTTTYYVAYDSTGLVQTRYDSDINEIQIVTPPLGLSILKVADKVTMMGTTTGGWTVVNGSLIAPLAPTTAQLLTAAQVTQIGLLLASYSNAIVQPVSYTSVAGVVKTYQTNTQSVDNLLRMTAAYAKAAATPTGFYWIATDNTQVPFTFADLQQLAAVMGVPGWTAFQNLQTKKASVMAATTVSAVQLITF